MCAIMTTKFSAVFMLCAMLLLANCIELEELEEAKEFASLAVDASRIKTRVLGDPLLGRDPLPGTSFDAMPTSGTARFQGVAIVGTVDDSDVSAGFQLVGRSDLTVDFGAGDDNIRGTLDDFQSSREGDGILDVSGTLDLQNGVVGAHVPNQFTVDYDGAVTVEGDRYALSGDMIGKFQGTRPEPAETQSTVRALTAIDINGRAQGDGETLKALVTIIAEN